MAATDGMKMKEPPNKGTSGNGPGVAWTGSGGKDVNLSTDATTPTGSKQGGDTIAWTGNGGKDVKLNNDAPQPGQSVPKGDVKFTGNGSRDVS